MAAAWPTFREIQLTSIYHGVWLRKMYYLIDSYLYLYLYTVARIWRRPGWIWCIRLWTSWRWLGCYTRGDATSWRHSWSGPSCRSSSRNHQGTSTTPPKDNTCKGAIMLRTCFIRCWHWTGVEPLEYYRLSVKVHNLENWTLSGFLIPVSSERKNLW